jgi:uncharacterized membrane protein YdbT with pleckstrin-like domain
VSGDGLRGTLERWLRIPPPPRAPAGAPESVRVFRAAPGFYRYRLLRWGLAQAGAVWGLFIGFTVLDLAPDFRYAWILHYGELLGVAVFVLQMGFSFLLVKIDFEYRWYGVTDRSLRIREGILEVREQTMSFANVQNLAVRQGPLQRLFGIADLEVRTAGGGKGAEPGSGGSGTNLHVGYLRGVDGVEDVRQAILERLRRYRNAGLGDPEDAGAARVAPRASLAAARELLAAARALRAG